MSGKDAQGSTDPVMAADVFSVDSETASALLGVSKTRLSQLTSAGLFSTEKRRVQTARRPRIFYRRSDLLRYVEAQSRPIQGAVYDPHGFASPAAPLPHTKSQSPSISQPDFGVSAQQPSPPSPWPGRAPLPLPRTPSGRGQPAVSPMDRRQFREAQNVTEQKDFRLKITQEVDSCLSTLLKIQEFQSKKWDSLELSLLGIRKEILRLTQAATGVGRGAKRMCERRVHETYTSEPKRKIQKYREKHGKCVLQKRQRNE